MLGVKQIDCRGVVTFNQWNFEGLHEPRERHPEVVTHHHDALDPDPVALAQAPERAGCRDGDSWACSHCSNWSSTINTLRPCDTELPAAGQSSPASPPLWQVPALPAQRFDQSDFRIGGGGLDIDRQHVLGPVGATNRP